MANKNKKYKRSLENAGTIADYIDAIYSNNPKEEFLGEPEHHYDFTQSEEWANAHGYYPDKRGHRDDRVKKPTHPSHPSKGTWEGNNFILTNKGLADPNYIFFGLNDGGQDPQAILKYKEYASSDGYKINESLNVSELTNKILLSIEDAVLVPKKKIKIKRGLISSLYFFFNYYLI